MQKTSKVTSATFDREFKGEFGAYFVHLVEFENNDKGEYTSQKKDQTNFVVGKDAMYDIVEKKNRNDEKFFKIIPVKEDDQKFTPSSPNRTVPAKSFDTVGLMVGNAISNACLMAAHGVIDTEKIEEAARKICNISMKLKSEFEVK